MTDKRTNSKTKVSPSGDQKKVKIFSKVEPHNIFRGKGFVLIIKSNFLGHFSVTHGETEKQRNGQTER